MIAEFFISLACIVLGALIALAGMFLNSYMWYLRDAVYDEPTPAQRAQVRLGTLTSILCFVAGLCILWQGSPVLAVVMGAFGVFYARFRRGVQPLLDEDRRKRQAGELTPPSRPTQHLELSDSGSS